MWKPIKNYEGYYEVNENGEVRSVDRIVTTKKDGVVKHLKGRYLIPHESGRGYPAVTLSKNRHLKTTYIHSLVAEAFLPQHDPNLVINHIDGNKWNNTVSNLEWITYSQNNQHAYDNGLKGRGEDFYISKLTEDQVRQIRKEGKYDTYENIAAKYNVSKAAIRCVLLNRTWKHITLD